jgi:hypothetical protein
MKYALVDVSGQRPAAGVAPRRRRTCIGNGSLFTLPDDNEDCMRDDA